MSTPAPRRIFPSASPKTGLRDVRASVRSASAPITPLHGASESPSFLSLNWVSTSGSASGMLLRRPGSRVATLARPSQAPSTVARVAAQEPAALAAASLGDRLSDSRPSASPVRSRAKASLDRRSAGPALAARTTVLPGALAPGLRGTVWLPKTRHRPTARCPSARSEGTPTLRARAASRRRNPRTTKPPVTRRPRRERRRRGQGRRSQVQRCRRT